MACWSICWPNSLPPKVQSLLLPINSARNYREKKKRWKGISVLYVPLQFHDLFLHTLIPKLLFPTCHKTCGHMILCNKQINFSLFCVVPLDNHMDFSVIFFNFFASLFCVWQLWFDPKYFQTKWKCSSSGTNKDPEKDKTWDPSKSYNHVFNQNESKPWDSFNDLPIESRDLVEASGDVGT